MMETFWLALAKKGLEALMGGEATKMIKELVTSLMDDDYTNDEKRMFVKQRVSPYLGKVGKLFLSTAIAFAVDYLKIEIAKKSQ